MSNVPSLLLAAHLVGLALAVGAATVKLVLLLRCRADPGLLPAYVAVSRTITRPLIVGMVVLTLSGIGWLVLGYPLTPKLVVKLVLVAALWILGPIIDNVVEPRVRRQVQEPGAPASPELERVLWQYVAIEGFATLLFYVIIGLWVVG